MNAPWQAVRRFVRNTRGRDFVVGDIHGAYDLVIQAMKSARFDPAVDRLFVPGDLVDRGEESMRARRFLRQGYVHCSRGNHEQWWIDMYADGRPQNEVVAAMGRGMGVGWWLNSAPADADELVDLFRALPLAMEIETERGVVGVVHADVPSGMNWDEFVQALERGDRDVVRAAQWGRARINAGDASGVPGIDRVFVGHTPQWGGLKQLGNVFAVDTGAIFGMSAGTLEEGRLTMALMVAATGPLVAAKDRLDTPGLVDLRDALPASGQPFGSYAVLAAEQGQ
ncbi:metallophosphoesterase [Ottowia sp.]|uniref:metallophosphoesterase n=1 Tax=Ottowia sp. TaxID=1898956 RepID=UPI0025E1708B|nr:metallophosphoesterase [Ottowia sp.]MBK6616506.1 metallophosphoesterase [Ottowia sp.]